MEPFVIIGSTMAFLWGLVRLYKHKRFSLLILMGAVIFSMVGTAEFHVTTLRQCQTVAASFVQTHPMNQCGKSCQNTMVRLVNECH